MSSWGYLPYSQGLFQESPMNSGKLQVQQSVIMNVSETIIVLDHGEMLCSGTPAEVANHPDVIKAYLGEEYSLVTD